MRRNALAFSLGLLFAVGLGIAGMADPKNVLAFLDVFGEWNPNLALVMAGGIAISFLPFQIRKMSHGKVSVDHQLVLGAAVFGAGWGLSGVCPGPAWINLVSGNPDALVFVGSMAAGMVLVHLSQKRPFLRSPRLTDA